MQRLIVSSPMPADVAARAARQFGADIRVTGELSADAILDLLEREPAQALLITSRLRMNADLIARLPTTLQIIATFSVGYDHVDVGAARRRGIVVTNTPDVLTDATADLTLLLLLAASRRAAEYQAIMAEGWGRRLGATDYLGVQVTGKTLGVIGMGRIGQAVARRAQAFGMKIAYHDRARRPPEAEGSAVYHAELEGLLAASDVISLHAPGLPGGAPLLDAARLARLRPGAILINTARGSLVDETALIEALESGRLHSAGLDVFANEPTLNPRLLRLKNVFLTPHVGSATQETRSAMGHRALDNIEAILAGRTPADAVG
jgi:hydroxypyruvate reductase